MSLILSLSSFHGSVNGLVKPNPVVNCCLSQEWLGVIKVSYIIFALELEIHHRNGEHLLIQQWL